MRSSGSVWRRVSWVLDRDALAGWALNADAEACNVPGEPVLGFGRRADRLGTRLAAESDRESVKGSVLALGLVQRRGP